MVRTSYEIASRIGEQLLEAQQREQLAAEAYRRSPNRDSRANWLEALNTLNRITACYLDASQGFVETEYAGIDCLEAHSGA